MLPPARRQRILERLARGGEVEVAGLAAELGISVETARRDLTALEQRRLLRRVHGGAVALPSPALPPVRSRIDRAGAAKADIAEAALPLVPAGAHVFLGAGSTMLALAARLADLPVRTTFVTNMIDIAVALRRGVHEVHLTGGEVDADTHAVGGPEALRFLERRLFDLAITGAAAIDAEHGVMGPTAAHAAITEILRRRARRRMVLSDHSKFGRSDRYGQGDLAEIDVLVTDRPPPEPFPARLAAAGVQLVVARGRRE
ncbi:DeoR/GlpR family DNA-binding transcription regulator [Labrys wisconsinensis]|uniref:DeoR/GlpR family transcriptional regulator of sugar metabolism n=1 Tax=Labrys wisconsinensis TaxID=425677 RepID=A0ABU0JGG5_9HYPH|nr:DeoR/GlpR family DNA-binding transcription regulator [Labrys wisconsinensis]MDQ0472665.1 DeoR/GlpR family transcriptional regulator of sugar metabolism [Labrys wisconsinensis]